MVTGPSLTSSTCIVGAEHAGGDVGDAGGAQPGDDVLVERLRARRLERSR